jgi:haloalkane dehalogenase
MISSEFNFESRFIEVNGTQIHFIERGTGQVFLFIHGNPTWSYLWRNIIPPVSSLGRCIAFDLVGFGKSARPDISYRFLEHYTYVEEFISRMGLKDIVLVGHDWGGVLGFCYAMNHPENVKGIACMETFPFTFPWDSSP